MRNTDIHLVKAAFHAQFKMAMEKCGVSADYYFNKVKLPMEVNDPASLLPLKPFFQLINIIAIEENMPGFGSLVARTTPWHEVLSLGPLLRKSKNLENLLEKFCKIASSQSSLVRFRLIDKGSHFEFCYTDIPIYKGDIQMELYRITSMIQLVQLASGSEWRPEAIRLNMPRTKAVDACPLLTKSIIRFSQPDSVISIPGHLLSMPVHVEIPSQQKSRENPDSNLDIKFSNSISQIINTYTLTKNINIEEVAIIAGMSVRSLQRRLAESGMKFNELHSQARFYHARQKLLDTRVPISEISKSLGYSDAAHFSRAFRRWSGLSPGDFRKSL